MNLYEVLFWLLTVVAIGSALGVILSRNPVSSVLFLIVTFFAVSGHYVLMNAQFLAIVNIIVYAGAIMVLFLFVIMLMNLNADAEPQKNRLVQLAGVLSGGILFLVVLAALKTSSNNLLEQTATDIGLIKNLGMTLFTKFVLPFEISSVLFLSAMIGAVVLGKKGEPQK
ncbi:MAG: NADH-quinone oxidoreductase subunit J [Chitinophagales bacterium]|nr:NADH-quinone oxidoreductase subunit J [Chitinophagaceae bacterium]MCB9064045.1 NADH-quinone oxidoreductase subunit J [Chitinophagales bacterium]